jgi:hypothetical protein
MRKTTVFAVVIIFILSTAALGGVNHLAKVSVHALPHAARSCVKSFPAVDGCEDILTTEAGNDVDAFPVFYDMIEYQGFDYGLTWPGAYSCSFTSCSDLTIGNILWPGDGISHAWYVCQYASVGITGWGWIYDNGMICVVPHPGTGLITIGDCHLGDDEPLCPQCAAIGGFIGDDPCEPCDPTAREKATWGGMKSLFR